MNLVGPRRLLTRRLRPGALMAADAVLAVLVSLLCVYATTERATAPAWLAVPAGVLVGAPLSVRRKWPVPVAGVVLAATVAALLAGLIPSYASAAPSAAVGCATYLVGVAVRGARSVVTFLVCLALLAGALLGAGADPADAVGGLTFAGLTVAGGWLLGWAIGERRAALARAAEQLAGQAASEERLRIARELHDIVAHSMSVITVKAAIANHVAEAKPEEVRDALRVIESTSRGALEQMRRTLGVLREGASYAPAPGLGELSGLVETAATGGVDVQLDVRGVDEVPEPVALSVFRIVQESLTNVVKHAAPCRCRVRVAVDPAEVRVEVTNDGPRVTATGSGHGLIGLRERVAVHGGELSAGPRTDGGFSVRARLPYGTGP